MTQERAKELLPIIQAFAEGKAIQCLMGGQWHELSEANFEGPPGEYRIKPEPREFWIVKSKQPLCTTSPYHAFETDPNAGQWEQDKSIIHVREVLE